MMKRLVCVCILLFVLAFAMTSCGQDTKYKDEIQMMNDFLKQKELSGEDALSVLDRYDISDKTVYYYIRCKTTESVAEEEILAVYDTKSQNTSFFSLSEISAENSEIGLKWKEIKNARADRVFARSEITEIIRAAKA